MPSSDSFAPWLESLAPGSPEPSRIARDRILYRAAEEHPRRSRQVPAFPGDSMNVDLDDGLRMPVEDAVEAGS